MDFVTAIAKQLITEHNLKVEAVYPELGGVPGPVHGLAYKAVEDMSPAVLGIISASGKPGWDMEGVSIHDIYNRADCSWLGGRSSTGLNILTSLAAAALTARIVEFLQEPIAVS